MAIPAAVATPMVLGGIVSAFGAAGGAQAARGAYQYNAVVNEFNAKLADLRAADAVEQGVVAEHGVARKAKQVKGSQVAQAAGSGLQLSGSALDILAGTDILAEYDIGTVKENTRKAVFTEEIAAQGFRTQAAFDRLAAEASSPFMAGLTSGLSTAGQVAPQWYGLSRTT